jgi:hypothetical protein
MRTLFEYTNESAKVTSRQILEKIQSAGFYINNLTSHDVGSDIVNYSKYSSLFIFMFLL